MRTVEPHDLQEGSSRDNAAAGASHIMPHILHLKVSVPGLFIVFSLVEGRF
jgi:hypothetical protein